MTPKIYFPKNIDGYTPGGRWVNPETGKRSDVPHNMIYPLKDTRPNLRLLTGVHVKHVPFDGFVFCFTPFSHYGWAGQFLQQ